MLEKPKSENQDQHQKSAKENNEMESREKSFQNHSLTQSPDPSTKSANKNGTSDKNSPTSIKSIKTDKINKNLSDGPENQALKNKNNKNSAKEQEYIIEELTQFKFIKNLHSRKDKLFRILGGIVGVIFIIAGVIYLFGSSIKVVDNVAFGERAVTSAFFIIAGLLIIAGLFARKFWETTFLKNLQNQLQVAEDKSTKTKDTQKDNIEVKDKK
jgi:hypothetical protein